MKWLKQPLPKSNPTICYLCWPKTSIACSINLCLGLKQDSQFNLRGNFLTSLDLEENLPTLYFWVRPARALLWCFMRTSSKFYPWLKTEMERWFSKTHSTSGSSIQSPIRSSLFISRIKRLMEHWPFCIHSRSILLPLTPLNFRWSLGNTLSALKRKTSNQPSQSRSTGR